MSRIQIYDTEVIVYLNGKHTPFPISSSLFISSILEEEGIVYDYRKLLNHLDLPLDIVVYDYRTSSLNIEEKQTDHPQCDGCGHIGSDVYDDGFGFLICQINGCTQYSVRGISPSDFY